MGTKAGIKKAKWIFTHDSYKMKGTKAYCRVNVKDAWHSYSKTHQKHPDGAVATARSPIPFRDPAEFGDGCLA